MTDKPPKRKRSTLAHRRKNYVPSAEKSRKLQQVRGLLHADEAARARRAERAEAAAVIQSLIDSDDVAALASPRHFAPAVDLLTRKLPPCNGLVGILFAGDGVTPWRLANGFGLVTRRWQVWDCGKVLKLIADAKGPAADTVRALLTGKGEPAAVMLRRVIEARRGAALPTFTLGGEQ